MSLIFAYSGLLADRTEKAQRTLKRYGQTLNTTRNIPSLQLCHYNRLNRPTDLQANSKIFIFVTTKNAISSAKSVRYVFCPLDVSKVVCEPVNKDWGGVAHGGQNSKRQKQQKRNLDMISYWIIFGGIMLVSMIVQWRFKSKFKKYSETPLSSGMTGRDVAEKMLHDNGIYDVQIISAQGRLSDHYNPANRTVNLSPEVYSGRSVAAAAVAAHECGHAVQHAKAYSWLQFRSAMVPIVSVASNLVTWVLMIGVLMMAFSGNPYVLAIGVAALAITTLFSFVTLPVEFDASRRALAWLDNQGITQSTQEHDGAKDALWWAAMTYVVAALS